VIENKVIWITGLPGSGKTTLAKRYINEIDLKLHPTIHLDGDDMRRELFNEFGYSKTDRMILARKYQNLTKFLYEQGFDVVVSTVSMYKSIYNENREKFKNYIEVYLEAELTILESGPRANLYENKEFNSNQKNQFDYPSDPNLTITRTSNTTIEYSTNLLVEYLKRYNATKF
jgi:adenylylsulfate kinase-like enzyme